MTDQINKTESASEVKLETQVSCEAVGCEADKYDELAKEITELINRKSLEGDSNTPDFILAEYLVQCLKLFNWTSNKRVKWQNSGHITTDDSQLSA